MTRGARFKVALIGASGLLGRAVANELAAATQWQMVRTAFRHGDANTVILDIRDEDAVRAIIADEMPDAIVVPAADGRPDGAGQDPAVALACTGDAVRC